ncbi:hypothetical protein Vretifemale_4623 [Volvox reticuliferus]|uniref:Prolyl endopeptidase-like n=1 Tax=Volvox reticuliferus TaxID=1737510 RepID=A0A8J4FHK9_9CHLO|nr:hypothetical protein Vretifemale_4623 [Volvox reticuliferus]
MATATPPLAPARPHEVVTPDGSKRDDPYAWLRDDTGKNPEVVNYLEAENEYGKGVLKANSKLETRILYDMDSRVPRYESNPATPSASLSFWYGSTRGPGDDYWVYKRRPGLTKLQGQPGPLSYGPDPKVSEQVVLDVNKLSKGFKYCDVGAVKPSPDGRYVAFTVDTIGNEQYELVIQEIGSGARVSFAGAEERSSVVDFGGMSNCAASVDWAADSRAVFALLLTPRTHEAYKLVRCRLQTATTTTATTTTTTSSGSGRLEPELLLQDDKSGAVLELVGHTSCGRFLMLSRKAEGYTALLALKMPAAPGERGSTSNVQQPKQGVPSGVKLYGTDPWVVVAPESSACDVLRADHLYGNGDGKETFAVLMDTDKYPDGCVCAVTAGDLKGRTVLVPGKRGRQIIDIVACGDGGDSAKKAAANGAANGAVPAANGAAAKGGRYLVVHTLEDMKALVQVYDLTPVKQFVEAKQSVRAVRHQERLRARAVRPNMEDGGGAAAVDNNDDDDADDDSHDGDLVAAAAADDDDEEEEEEGSQQRQSKQAMSPQASQGPLTCVWTFSPGPTISSLHIDHGCWPGKLPYVRVSYSNLTTPTTTVDLDIAAHRHYVREVEKVEHWVEGRYMSETLWATSSDGTSIPATVACRTDAWPPKTGRPLPCILQAYGAYGRKLLPDFIPGDMAMLDGGAREAAAAGNADADADADAAGCGPCLMVLAHVRGGGELGAHWHVEGKKRMKVNTAEDIAAVVRMLVEKGYARPEAVALWGRSAGGLAMGMTLERCPAGTFRAAVLDVPFLDVLGAMTDPSLPLTIKERPEWGDPASSQEDYDYIRSYSPYDNVEKLASKTPAIIVTCSLNDPRVPYWGPAKFVARLRAVMAAAAAAAAANGGAGSVAGGPVVLLTELEAGGHFAASGASGRLAERAMRVAFLLGELKKALDGAASGAPVPVVG